MADQPNLNAFQLPRQPAQLPPLIYPANPYQNNLMGMGIANFQQFNPPFPQYARWPLPQNFPLQGPLAGGKDEECDAHDDFEEDDDSKDIAEEAISQEPLN
jgi:hypothetical protein